MLKLKILTLLFGLSLLAPLAAAEQAQPMLQVEQAIRSNDFSAALKLCDAALREQPNDVRLWSLRGLAAAGAHDSQQALDSYQHALVLAPGFFPALAGAAQAAYQLNKPEARSLLEKVLERHPADPAAHLMLGFLDFRTKQCAPAIEHFEKAEPLLGQQAAALGELGQCLSEAARNDEALAAFERAFALEPASREARFNLALAQWNAHRADDALATLEPLCTSSPADGDALELSAQIEEDKGDTAVAIPLLRQAIVSDPKRVSAYLVFATLSYDHASPRVGIDMLDVGIQQSPAEPRLLLVRGILLTQLGEFTRAADDFEAARKLDAKLGFLDVAKGLVLSQQHNSTEALARFRAGVREHPNDAYGHYLLAEALQELGKPEGSPEYNEELKAAERAAELDPKLVDALDLLSGILLDAGHPDEAATYGRAALAANPNDQQAVYHMVVALRRSDPNHELPAMLKRLVELRSHPSGEQSHQKRFRLVEESASGEATSATPAKP